ncbi:hypothetical protein WA158_000152 [Blastocystis sp. Blastoise]
MNSVSNDLVSGQPIVIDNGTGVIKAGFAEQEKPSCVIPNYIGEAKYSKLPSMKTDIDEDKLFGSKAEQYRGVLSLSHPMEHGIISDWNDMEQMWRYIFSKDQLNVNPEEHPVFLTEAPLNPQKSTEKMAEIFFDTFNVPALFIAPQAVLSLYASGRSTGVVLDIGDGVSHVYPVYQGFSLTHAINRIDLGGRDVTNYLQLLCRKNGYTFATTAELDLVRQIKEQCSYCRSSRGENAASQPIEYPLPDGKKMTMDSELWRAPECLFNPSLLGYEYQGVHELLLQSIMKCDIDIRRELFSEIILSGGTTMTKCFGNRLLNELKENAPQDVKLRIYAPPERQFSTWMGGSILSSLGSFKGMWITKDEYKDGGSHALFAKCL